MMARGILAIWNDCRAGQEADFERWFQREHLEERLAVPGFLFGRRHEAVSGSPGVFTFYVTEAPAVLTSQPYLDRLNTPTPLTRHVMSNVFVNMSRTLCERTLALGAFRGAYAVTARLNIPAEGGVLERILREFAVDAGFARGEIWTAAASAPLSMEEKLRGGDKRIAGCVLAETLRLKDAEAVAAKLAVSLLQAEIGIYKMLAEIGRSDA